MRQRRAPCVMLASTARRTAPAVWTATPVRQTMTAIRLHRAWLAQRGNTRLAVRHRAQTVRQVVQTWMSRLQLHAWNVQMVSIHLLPRLCALNVLPTRWTMTQTRPLHVWDVQLATCHYQVQSDATRVKLVSSTTCLSELHCAQGVRSASTSMQRHKPPASAVLLENTRVLLVWTGVPTVSLVRTRTVQA